jgi:hypothetical protein
LLKDYKPENSTSPEDGKSVVASSVTILDLSNDFVRFQRIEAIELLQHRFNTTDKCHLIGKAHCAKFTAFEKYKNDENNILSMAQHVHGWFDGRGSNVPLFILDYISHDDVPMANLDNRYEVRISVTALDVQASKLIFPRLSHGSFAVEGDDLKMVTHVYVRDPTTFKFCLDWKSASTAKKWNRYRAESNRD